MMDTGRKKKNT